MNDMTPQRTSHPSRAPLLPRLARAIRGLFLGFAVIALCASPLPAAEKAPKPATEKAHKPADKSSASDTKLVKSDSPFNITSDRMEAHQKDKTILFLGHVVVRQDDLVITGAKMTVYGAASEKDKNADDSMMQKIDRIEVEGDVKITQREKIATSDKAIFYHQEQKVVLMGNPMVSQGQDVVRGRLITLYLAQGKSVVEGGEQTPVQAVFHPAKKE